MFFGIHLFSPTCDVQTVPPVSGLWLYSLYLLLCLLGTIETRRLLVFWVENVFVLCKKDSYEKELRGIARDRFIMED